MALMQKNTLIRAKSPFSKNVVENEAKNPKENNSNFSKYAANF